MLKRRFAVALSLLWILPSFSMAQTQQPSLPFAVISGSTEVAVGRTIVLDASSSRTASGTVTYRWFEGDSAQPISRTVEALFTPEQPGEYTIRVEVSQVIDGTERTSSASQRITAYTRKIALVTDGSVQQEKIDLHQQSASQAGVFLQVLKVAQSSIPLGIQESLTQLIGDQFDKLSNADAIVLWTDDPVAAMQALMNATRSDDARLQGIQNQSVVLISENSLNTLSRAVRAPLSVLSPKRLYLTRKEAINPLLEAADMTAFEEAVQRRDIEVVIEDASSLSIRPWNVLTSLVTYMLTHGVSSQTIIFLLMLPIIATILAFLKQIIGISTYGLYTPSIIALSFIALGWAIGIMFLTFILVATYAARRVMRKWRILYVPKIAIILTVVSITLMLALALGAVFEIVVTPDTIFVLLIMSTLSESFVMLESEEGRLSALYSVVDTVLAALLCVFIVRWPTLQSFVIAYPESILLTIFINIGLGKYTGLRLTEYFRFRSVFQHLQE